MPSQTKRPVMDEKLFAKLIDTAHRTNIRRDAAEHAAGFGAPLDGSLDDALRTVLSALEAGICTNDQSCLAEGFAMLQLIELRIRRKLRDDPTQRMYREPASILRGRPNGIA